MLGDGTGRHRWLVVLLTLTLVGAGIAAPAPEVSAAPAGQARPATHNVEPVGQVSGSMAVVAVRGGFAFVGQASRLVVFDLADPARPRPVFRSAPLGDEVTQVVISDSGEYVYAVASSDADLEGGVFVFLVADPTNPRQVSSYPVPDFRAQHLELVGSLGYVMAPGRRQLVDFSDPASPTLLADHVLPVGPIAVADHYAYVYSFRPPLLQVFDIADPAHPVQVGSMDEQASVDRMMVQGPYLYLLSKEHALDVADLSDPASPRLVAQASYARDSFDGLTFDGSRAYLTSRFRELVAVADYSDPLHPVTLGKTRTNAGPPQMAAVNGDYAYVAAAAGGLRVFAVSDPAHPTEIGSYDGPGQPTGAVDIAVAGGLAYVADEENGLHILRVDDPATPTPVGVYREGTVVRRVVVRGPYAYVLAPSSTSDTAPGLRILDVRDPTRPTMVGGWSLRGAYQDLALVGSYAFVLVNGGLHILDVSDPALPRVVGAYDPPLDPSIDRAIVAGSTGRIAVAGSMVYLASAVMVSGGRGTTPSPSPEGSGLRVVDVSNPAAPAEVSFTRLAWAPQAVATVESQLYVVGRATGPAGESGLRLFDISDASHPIPGVALPTGAASFGGGIALTDHRAYVSGWGLHILDVSDASHPAEVGSHPLLLHGVAAEGDLIYAGAGSGGLEILRFNGRTP